MYVENHRKLESQKNEGSQGGATRERESINRKPFKKAFRKTFPTRFPERLPNQVSRGASGSANLIENPSKRIWGRPFPQGFLRGFRMRPPGSANLIYRKPFKKAFRKAFPTRFPERLPNEVSRRGRPGARI